MRGWVSGWMPRQPEPSPCQPTSSTSASSSDFSPPWLTKILESFNFNQYCCVDFLIYHCDISVFFLRVPSHRPRCSLTLKWCGLTSTVWLSTVLFTTRSPQVTRSHLSLSLSFGIFASQRIENNLAFVSFYTTFEARASKCHSKPGWLVLKIYISFRWGIHTRWSFFSWRVFGVNMTHLSLFCLSTYGARTNLSFSLPQPGHSLRFFLLCEIMNFNSLSRFSQTQSISAMPWCRLSVVWCSTDILRRLFQEVLKKKNGYQINFGNDSAMMAPIVWK